MTQLNFQCTLRNHKIWGLFLLLNASTPMGVAYAASYTCSNSVIVMAEVYADSPDYVDKAEDTTRKVCYLSVNGATKDADADTAEQISSAFSIRRKLLEQYQQSFDVNNMRKTAVELSENLAFILGAPLLQKGEIPSRLLQIVSENSERISKCLERFYTGENPYEIGKSLDCITVQSPNPGDILEIRARYSDLIYSAYFRR